MAEDQLFLANFGLPSRTIEVYPKSVYQYFVGENFHLTRSKDALIDLPTALGYSFAIIRTLTRENVRFAAILLSRQMITAVRTGGWETRLQISRIFLSGLKAVSVSLGLEILKCMWFVVWNRESII